MAALLGCCADLAVASTPAYAFDRDARRLVVSAPGAIRCATSPGGFVTLTSEGDVQSSDPFSAHYEVALAGLTGETLREIQVSQAATFSLGPFDGERLTLTSTRAVELTDVIALVQSLSVAARGIAVNGDVRVPGLPDDDGASRGGAIRVLGERVTIGESARLSTSGDTGGGQILLGGDLLGGNGVPTAAVTRIARGALIRADALAGGDGGRVIVWAEDRTVFHGHISARGGPTAGHGGFVEVSCKAKLAFTGAVDTDAPHGNAGTLLLDPANITIQAMAPDINGDTTTGDDITNAGQLDNAATDFPGTNSVITDGALEAVLSSSNVTLAATNNITFNSVINLNSIGSAARTLTMRAGNTITINGGGGFSAAGATAPLNLVFEADADNNDTGRFFTQGNIDTDGGSITITARDSAGAPTNAVFLDARIATNGGDLVIAGADTTDDIVVSDDADLSVGTGNLTLTGDRINIDPIASLAGAGQLTLQPRVASTALTVGGPGSTSTVFLTSAELATIASGFDAITVGRADSSGAITVSASGAAFNAPLVLRSSGTFNINGVLALTEGAGVTLENGGSTAIAATGGISAAGPVAFAGAGAVTLLGPVTATNDTITFAGAVTTGAAPVALSGGTVTFQNALTINAAGTGSLAVVGDLVLAPTANWNLSASGTAPGAFDALSVTGAVTLGGTLAPTFGFTPQGSDTVLFIDNDAAGAVNGGFSNQPAGSELVVNGTRMLLLHTLGDGNDVGFVVDERIFRDGFESIPAHRQVPGAAQGTR